MSVLTNIASFLTQNIRTIVISVVIIVLIFIIYKLSKFYAKVFSLPPGPIPLPIIGNLYIFGIRRHWTLQLEKVADKYGPVFTFWTGTFPVVFISDIHIGQEVYHKNDFAGRPVNMFTRLINKEGNTDVASADYGDEWQALRSVAHSALQKYFTTDQLVYLSSDCVDHTIKSIIEKEGLNNPFDPCDYFCNTFFDIMITSTFGVRLDWDDPDFKTIANTQKTIFDENCIRLGIWEMFPFLLKIDKNSYNKIQKTFDKFIDLIEKRFKSHEKDYNESVVRDFCDTVICAKNIALRDSKESAPYLKNENLVLVVLDLLFAGTITSVATFKWILFFVTYYPEIQKKLRQEIETQIGDRIPTKEDKNCCHYVMAFISEAFRLRNVFPQGANHHAIVTSDYTIPKGTQISLFQGHIMHKEEYWTNAQEFRPERFLDQGQYLKARPKAFIPFGIGRRVCLGERLAIDNLFLVLVRFLQNTVDYELTLHYSGDTLPKIFKVIDLQPKDFKISLKKIK